MVQGVDLWLNNPRRGEEACGTSGMKAAMNGVLNLSILDGWFDEAYEISGGWAIGDREPYSEDQDDLHASAIYSMLENEIVPLFYQNQDSDEDIPTEWVRRMKTCIANLTPRFGCGRMVAEYMSELYQPAHNPWLGVSANNFEAARQKTVWDSRVTEAWNSDSVCRAGRWAGGSGDQRLGGAGAGPGGTGGAGAVGCARGSGRRAIGVNGQLESTFTLTLVPGEERGTAVVFSNEFMVQQTGRVGYSVRVSPNHFDNPLDTAVQHGLKWVSD